MTKPDTSNGRWRVNIRETASDTVIHTIWCNSEREAERVERGVGINLNHDRFHTEIADHGDFDNDK